MPLRISRAQGVFRGSANAKISMLTHRLVLHFGFACLVTLHPATQPGCAGGRRHLRRQLERQLGGD